MSTALCASAKRHERSRPQSAGTAIECGRHASSNLRQAKRARPRGHYRGRHRTREGVARTGGRLPGAALGNALRRRGGKLRVCVCRLGRDRKSTRLNSSHLVISYAVFCLKKKKNRNKYINYVK